MYAGGVRWGASRFPLPARSATRALQHSETDCDFPPKSRLPNVFGGVDDADLHVVVVDVVLSVAFDSPPVDLPAPASA